MFPLKRSLIALSAVALAACGSDNSVNPVAELVDGNEAAITTGGTLIGTYDLLVGQSVKINPKSTTRTNRLRWSTSNSGVATVNSQGTVTARASGSATVQVSGTGVLENYAIAVKAPTAPTVTSFSLQPKTGITLQPGQTRQFQPTATWSDGKQYALSVTYTAAGGTISSNGLFTAGNAAGTFAVVASCLCGAVDTAFVTVDQLTKLTISPKSVSLNAGATQQFTVAANWATGSTTLPPVTWSADAGSVTQTGLYTAPATAGTYRVVVAHTGGAARDTAVVTVSGGSVVPPSGGTSASCPNEPSGYTLYGDVTLASLTAPTGFTFWGDNKSLVTDNIIGSAATVLAWRKPAGTTAGAIGFFATQNFAVRPRAVFSCVVFRRSPNYVEQPSGTKFIYPFVANAASNDRPFQVGMLPVDSTTSGKFRWMIEMYSGDAIQRMRPSNINNTILENGKWYRLEFLAISNTPGGQNSVIRWWTSEWNGSGWSAPVLNGDYNNARFAADGTGAWVSWDYNMYYGGSDGPATPADQFIYLHRARISVSGN
jgi:hypothetical protein